LRCEPAEERHIAVLVDEFKDRIHGFPRDANALAAPTRSPLRGHSVAESGARIRTVRVFAALETRVAALRQERREGREALPEGRCGHGGDAGLCEQFFAAIELDRVQAGEQAAQGRAADARRGISHREHGSLRREAVQIRGSGDLRSHESEIAVTVIVADDQDDVRRQVGGVVSAGAEQQNDRDGEPPHRVASVMP
jgi:hypothetical protein